MTKETLTNIYTLELSKKIGKLKSPVQNRKMHKSNVAQSVHIDDVVKQGHYPKIKKTRKMPQRHKVSKFHKMEIAQSLPPKIFCVHLCFLVFVAIYGMLGLQTNWDLIYNTIDA